MKRIIKYVSVPIIFALVVLAFLFLSCKDSTRHDKTRKVSKVKVHTYKQKSKVVDNDPSNDWLFWYVIYANLSNSGACSYYYSTSPLTSYSSVNWTKSEKLPEEMDKENLEELNQEDINVEDLSPEMQSELDAGNVVTVTDEEIDNETETESNSESESSSESSTDGGSSSDSGGDSGGGDGGGGE